MNPMYLARRSLWLVPVLVAGATMLGSEAPALAAATAPGPLSITQSASSPVLAGSPMTFTLTATNTTSSAATNVSVGGQLPSTFNNLKLPVLPAPFGCQQSHAAAGINYFCALPDLAAGASESITVGATPTQVGTYTNVANVSGSAGGTFMTNSVSMAVQVDPGATDLQVTGFASTGSPAVGSTYTYTFQVKNSGPQPAWNVAFSDSLPASLTFVGATSSSGDACSYAASTVSCSISALGVGSQANVVITVGAPASAGNITDVASISASQPDPQTSNNSVAVTVQVK